MYSVFCPEIVRKYDNFSDFRAQGKGRDQLVSCAYGITGAPTRLPGRRKLSDEQFLIFHKRYVRGQQHIDFENPVFLEAIQQVPIRADYDPENISIDPERLDAAFWFLRDCSDRYFWFARLVVQVFYGIGFVLFSWVMVQNFLYVISLHLLGHQE